MNAHGRPPLPGPPDPEQPAPLALPIDGVLDLHGFLPRDANDLVRDYLEECRQHGLLEVRIIHGKGIGELRRGVHITLSRMPEVASYALASEAYGGTGATIVRLKPTADGGTGARTG